MQIDNNRLIAKGSLVGTSPSVDTDVPYISQQVL